MNNDFRLILNKIKSTQQNNLHQTCLMQLSFAQIQEINKTIPLLKQTLTIYNNNKDSFIQTTLTLIPNLLIIQNEYLVLSNCTIIKFKSKQEYCIQLTNTLGNLLIFFLIKEHYKQWITKLKQFCKLSNFSRKFFIKEQNISDYYLIQHKKTNKVYIANICPIQNTQMELISNEISTLRSVKHSSLLDLKWVYQDCRNIYLIYEYFKCEKLITLLKQGLILDQTQLASIILQLLQLTKFLNKQSIYHGNITLNNILINIQSTYLSIFLINMKSLNKFDKQSIDQYKKSIEINYLAPEILEGSSNPSIDTDLYQIGVVLYFLTTFQLKQEKDNNNNSNYINCQLIKQMEQYFIETSEIQSKQYNLQEEYKMAYSTSQLDLLKRLLDKKDQRIKLEEAMKHHWFVNIKQKFKPKQERKKQHLPSLNTIIELCEQSEYTRSFLSNQQKLDDEQVLDENNLIQEFMSELDKNNTKKPPSRENHEKIKDFQNFKTSYEQIKSNAQNQYKVSKTIF